VSHGFKKYQVDQVQQFFDPMHLSVKIIGLDECTNKSSRTHDYYFVEGYKHQIKKDYSKALQLYEKGAGTQGIDKKSQFRCWFNRGVVLFRLGLMQEALE